MQGTGNDEFQARLARIGAERRVAAGNRPGAPSKQRQLAENSLYPLSLVGAFLLGSVAVAIGQYARFHLVGGGAPQPDSEIDLIIGGAMGAGLSFVLSQAFKLRSAEHVSLQGAGVFAAVCVIHNLFHWLPAPMTALFSADHVALMQERTVANSIRLGGFTFLFDTATPVEAATDPMADVGLRSDPVAPDGETRPDTENRSSLIVMDSEK